METKKKKEKEDRKKKDRMKKIDEDSDDDDEKEEGWEKVKGGVAVSLVSDALTTFRLHTY